MFSPENEKEKKKKKEKTKNGKKLVILKILNDRIIFVFTFYFINIYAFQKVTTHCRSQVMCVGLKINK